MLELIRQSNKIERYLLVGNVVAALVNVALAFAFDNGPGTGMNWFVAGVCTTMVASLTFVIRWRLLLERQDNALMAATKMVEMLIAPDHYEHQLRRIMEQAKRDGVLPADVELFRAPDDRPKLH